MEKEKSFHVVYKPFLLYIGTEHEVSEEYIEVEEITEILDTNAMLIKAGYVSHILEDSYVIDAGKNAK